jgi:hypothetical protein
MCGEVGGECCNKMLPPLNSTLPKYSTQAWQRSAANSRCVFNRSGCADMLFCVSQASVLTS